MTTYYARTFCGHLIETNKLDLEEDLYRHVTELSVRDFLLLVLVHEIRDLKHEIDALQEFIAPGRD